MGRKSSVAIAAVAALLLLGGGAYAARRYVITSTKQIKPSVLKKFQPHLTTGHVLGPQVTMCQPGTGSGTCAVQASDARCPGSVVGGGFDGGSNPPADGTMGYDEPDADGHGWHIIMINNDTSGRNASFRTVAVCLGASAHFASDARARVPASVKAQIAREKAQLLAAAR